jgi:5-enolpyruvylshikimate-3-phosphate synthase
VTREELESRRRADCRPGDWLVGTTVEPWEMPLVIDEVPVLAMLAAHADGVSRFVQAGELR